MPDCTKCGNSLGRAHGVPGTASISGSILGDESTETYYLCPACGMYTVEICDDRFCGEEIISVRGPLTKEDGQARVDLIGRCSEPWNKRCRCAAHVEYFRGWLD